MDKLTKIKIDSLSKKVNDLLDNAPSIKDCDNMEEIYMYVEMKAFKNALEKFLKS